MSEIKQLENVPELSFIDGMTLRETEELVREHYIMLYRENYGEPPTLAGADTATLLIKAFSLVLYQVMQYIESKGRAEMLKTATGDALDSLGALQGILRQEAKKARVKMKFTLSAVRDEAVGIPLGTRVKTKGGIYFSTVEYGEIPCGELDAEVTAEAIESGTGSNGISVGSVDTLVDPIPYVASVANVTESIGGADTEDDDSFTERLYLAPAKFSSAGPRDAYEYYIREWSSAVEDVEILSPDPCIIQIFLVMDGGRLPTQSERESLAEYLNAEERRPLGDRIEVLNAKEVAYDIDLTYWIGRSDQKSADTIQKNVNSAIAEYAVWQRKLGRDINPTELIAKVRGAGAKRVKLVAPNDVVIEGTQLPALANTKITYGGLESD